MNNSQVAQAWAKQDKPEARTDHFYFVGDTIYSYGGHFPIARHYKGAVLFTSRGYSNSTAKHKSHVWRACFAEKLRVFNVSHPQRNVCAEDVADMATSIKNSVAAIGRARHKEYRLEALQREIEQANEFCSWFGFETRFEIPQGLADLVALAEKCKAFLGTEAGAYKLSKELMAA